MTLSSLIAIPSPRDIPIVEQSINEIKDVPKLWVKYFPEGRAYKIIEQYFLDETDADYLVIAPDDLVVGDREYRALVQTIMDHGGPDKIPTLSGVCNIHNLLSYRTQLAISIDKPIPPQRKQRYYAWADVRHENWHNKGYDKLRLLEVKFSGFACQFIRRDIVEELGLQGDSIFNLSHKIRGDCSFDVVFCYNCLHHKPKPIPIYVNPQVWMLHLRGSSPDEVQGIEPILVGKKEPKVVYIDGKCE